MEQSQTEKPEEIVREIRHRKQKKLPVAVTEEEFISLIKITKHKHHKLAFLLAFESGLRISEVVKLEQRDIDFSGKKIFIREAKGMKDRVVPLPKRFKEDYLKIIPIGIGERALQKAFKKNCEMCGILKKKPTAHFHSLRHGFATHFLEQGGQIQFLKVLMGHEDISTTDVYNQLNPKEALKQYEELF